MEQSSTLEQEQELAPGQVLVTMVMMATRMVHLCTHCSQRHQTWTSCTACFLMTMSSRHTSGTDRQDSHLHRYTKMRHFVPQPSLTYFTHTHRHLWL